MGILAVTDPHKNLSPCLRSQNSKHKTKSARSRVQASCLGESNIPGASVLKGCLLREFAHILLPCNRHRVTQGWSSTGSFHMYCSVRPVTIKDIPGTENYFRLRSAQIRPNNCIWDSGDMYKRGTSKIFRVPNPKKFQACSEEKLPHYLRTKRGACTLSPAGRVQFLRHLTELPARKVQFQRLPSASRADPTGTPRFPRAARFRMKPRTPHSSNTGTAAAMLAAFSIPYEPS